jgi:hypothetical protein
MTPGLTRRRAARFSVVGLFFCTVLASGCGRPPDEAWLRFLGFRTSGATTTLASLSGDLNDGGSDSVDAAFENASITLGATSGSTGTGILVTSAHVEYTMSGHSPPSADYPLSLYLPPGSVSSGTVTYSSGTVSGLPLAAASLKDWLIKTGAFDDPDKTPVVRLTAKVTFSAVTDVGGLVETTGSIALALTNSGGSGTATDQTVSVAWKADAVIGGADGGFTVSRSGSTATELVVNFATAGSAESGSGLDYASIGTSVLIPAGSASTTITVIALTTALSGSKVIVNLGTSSSYTVGTPASATVTII